MNINALQQLLDFYDKNLRAPGIAGAPAGTPMANLIGGGQLLQTGEGRPGLSWAMNFLRQQDQSQHPDFFGGTPGGGQPDYVRPQPVDMNAPRPMNARPDYFNGDPIRPQVTNYLARFMQTRQGG